MTINKIIYIINNFIIFYFRTKNKSRLGLHQIRNIWWSFWTYFWHLLYRSAHFSATGEAIFCVALAQFWTNFVVRKHETTT